jgi:hypothetical protein
MDFGGWGFTRSDCLGVRWQQRGRTAKLPTERLLERLQAVEDTLQGKVHWVVNVLRSREVTWAVIGGAPGISRQAAWERFS